MMLSFYDLVFLMCAETAKVDAGAEPDEEKPETPVKICFVAWARVKWSRV